MSANPRPAFSLPSGYSVRMYESRDRSAIMAIEAKRHAEWKAAGIDMPVADPDTKEWVSRVVVVDETDTPIAGIGARRIAEVGTTIDRDRLGMHEWRDVLGRAWAKLAADLWKQGYEMAWCRVTSPTPGWVNMLMRRAKWVKQTAPNLVFDLEEAFATPQKNG